MSSERQEETVLPDGWPEESAQRLEKARALQGLGVELYPTRFERTHGLAQVAAEYGGKTMEELEALRPPARIAGRVMLKRPHGKASFATLSDGEGELQVYVRQDDVGAEAYRMLDRARASCRCRRRSSSSCPRRCCRRPRSGTVSPTWRRATDSATSTS